MGKAEKKKAGKIARKSAAKKNVAAMKKKGVGIFAPKTLSPALAEVCGGKVMPRTEVTKKIWAYIKKYKLNDGRTIKPDAKLKAIFPREPRHVEDGWLREQAPLLRPWASPGHSAEEFRRRAGLSSRNRTSTTRVMTHGLLTSISLSYFLLSFSPRTRLLVRAVTWPARRETQPRRRRCLRSDSLWIFRTFRRRRPRC